MDSAGLKDPKTHESTKISALFNLGRLYADEGKYKVGTILCVYYDSSLGKNEFFVMFIYRQHKQTMIRLQIGHIAFQEALASSFASKNGFMRGAPMK